MQEVPPWISWPPEHDAVTAAPDSHKILLENDQVRVLHVVVEPGQKEPLHTHELPSIFIHRQSAPLRYYDHNDQVAFITDGLTLPDTTEYLTPEGLHAVENIGAVRYEAIRIELKNVPPTKE